MIAVEKFTQVFLKLGMNYFTGVPDSVIKDWLVYLYSSEVIHRIAVNEGSAIAHATGYYLSTGKLGVVYMQNSGLGNCINPLTSLNDRDVYGVPLIMVIGWRGEPGYDDEPQHEKMGKITTKMLEIMDIPYAIINKNNYKDQIVRAKAIAEEKQTPYALLIRKNSFTSCKQPSNNVSVQNSSREEVIRTIVDAVDKDDIIISTTGKATRELYDICDKHDRGHTRNFYNVGSMGHVSSIGLELAMQKNKIKIYVLDGDGAVMMHMGALATIGFYKPKNLIHVVFDNESYESTGGQPTVSSFLKISEIMKGCSYKYVDFVFNKDKFSKFFNNLPEGLYGIVIKVKKGSRVDLCRPSDSPRKTKERFMLSIVE